MTSRMKPTLTPMLLGSKWSIPILSNALNHSTNGHAMRMDKHPAATILGTMPSSEFAVYHSVFTFKPHVNS